MLEVAKSLPSVQVCLRNLNSEFCYLLNNLYFSVIGGWGNWENWTPCDSSTGTKKRTRQCDNPSPLNGGAPCAGNSQESLKCPGMLLKLHSEFSYLSNKFH